MEEINNLKTIKATQSTDIPTKCIKKNSDSFGDFIFGNFDNCISNFIFPNSLKNAIITPVHKKGAKNSKDNYRPVGILSNISKKYEKILLKQITKETQRKDIKRNFTALLTDPSNAFDSLPHDLAKLNAYGFSLPSLRLVQSYLSNIKQRNKINSEFSSWEEILFGVRSSFYAEKLRDTKILDLLDHDICR